MPSLHDLLRPRKRSVADGKDIEDGAQQKTSPRQSRHRRQTTAGRRESVEIAESPSRSDYTSDLHNLGVTTIMKGSQDKGDSTTEQTQRHKVHSGQRALSSTSNRQLDPERRSYRESQAKDGDTLIQTTRIGEISLNVSNGTLLGVYGQRKTSQGPEYCCLIGTWLRPEDGIPDSEIQEYDREVVQSTRRQSLRKRKWESDHDNTHTQVLGRVRRWKADL